MAIERSHLIAVYWPNEPGQRGDPYAVPSPAWQFVRSGIRATLEPLAGDVQQTAAGRAIDATWRGFVSAADAQYFREDAAVVVLQGEGPTTYRVREFGPMGSRWDAELLLAATAEVIP